MSFWSRVSDGDSTSKQFFLGRVLALLCIPGFPPKPGPKAQIPPSAQVVQNHCVYLVTREANCISFFVVAIINYLKPGGLKQLKFILS